MQQFQWGNPSSSYCFIRRTIVRPQQLQCEKARKIANIILKKYGAGSKHNKRMYITAFYVAVNCRDCRRPLNQTNWMSRARTKKMLVCTGFRAWTYSPYCIPVIYCLFMIIYCNFSPENRIQITTTAPTATARDSHLNRYLLLCALNIALRRRYRRYNSICSVLLPLLGLSSWSFWMGKTRVAFDVVRLIKFYWWLEYENWLPFYIIGNLSWTQSVRNSNAVTRTQPHTQTHTSHLVQHQLAALWKNIKKYKKI